MRSPDCFLKFMQSVDAFFPVGAFTLSNGLESYVLEERLQTPEDLKEYLHGFLMVFPYQDLGIAHFAFTHGMDIKYLCKLDQLTGAMKGAKEVRLGSCKMGIRFLKARTAMHDCEETLQWYRKLVKGHTLEGYYPIALGIYAASVFETEEESQFLSMYGYSVISAIVNNAVKLVPLSQMDGQRILSECLPSLSEAVEQVQRINEEELGICGGAMEISCMRHEQLYSRQYMS